MCYTFNPIDLSKDLFQLEPFFAVSIARFCTVVLFLVATLNWRHQILFKFHSDTKVESFWTTSIVPYFLYTVTTRRYLILITEIRVILLYFCFRLRLHPWVSKTSFEIFISKNIGLK